MSLQARIEAVIYAAEEPVTLAQLSAIFGEEALAERDVRLRDQAPDHAPAGPAPSELFASEPSRTAETAADEYAGQPVSDAAITQAVEHPEQVAATQADGFAQPADEPGEPTQPVAGAAAPGNDAATEAMLEEKRLARIRDREARDEVRRILEELIAAYDRGNRGIEIREIAGGYRVATRPEYHDAVRRFVKSLKPPMKLTLQALETLAVIAYKQPVTAPEVSEIRGVDSGGVLGSLISRKLVTTAGRKQVIGRPILYKTTKEFLLRFGLRDLAELPSMEEFEKMAGELVDAEAPAAQMELTGSVEIDNASDQDPAEGENAMTTGDPEQETDAAPAPVREPEDEQGENAPVREPSEAEDVQAAPERAEELEDEELVARARAAVRVDDESTPGHDLPGVHRDTAGRMDIDSVSHRSAEGWDEGNY